MTSRLTYPLRIPASTSIVLLSFLFLFPTYLLAQESKCGSSQATWIACGFINTPVDPSTLNPNTYSSNLNSNNNPYSHDTGGNLGVIGSPYDLARDGNTINYDRSGVIGSRDIIPEELLFYNHDLEKRDTRTYFCCAPSATCVVTQLQHSPVWTACYDPSTGQYVLNNQTNGVEANRTQPTVIGGVYVDTSTASGVTRAMVGGWGWFMVCLFIGIAMGREWDLG